MALIKCWDCGESVSDSAKKCEKCGAKPKSKSKWFWALIFFVFTYMTVSFMNRDRTVPPSGALKVTESASANDVVPSAVKKWEYLTIKDEMTGGPISVAVIKSDEQLSFKFPYAGENQPKLLVRRNGKNVDVIFKVDKGQIHCRSTDCFVSAKFDEGELISYKASEPADSSTTVIFISDVKQFLAKLKKAKTLRMQITFYKQGTHVITFNTDNLVFE